MTTYTGLCSVLLLLGSCMQIQRRQPCRYLFAVQALCGPRNQATYQQRKVTKWESGLPSTRFPAVLFAT